MRRVLFIIIGLIFFSYGLGASAQDDSPVHTIDTYMRFMPSCTVNAQSGKVEIIEAESEYSYEFKVFEELPVTFSLDTQYISIEDTVAVELPANLTGLSFDLETTLPFFNFKNTYICSGISPSFYADDWDFSASSFRIPLRSYLIYQPNDKWTFIGGLALYPDFEDELMPILGFIYQPNDKLTFNIIPDRPNITYKLDDKISLFAEGDIFNREFEVDRNQYEDVVLRYRGGRLGAGVEYKLNKYLRTSIQVGGVFNRSLKYRDNLGKVDIKDGFYSELRLQLAF